ATASAAPNLRAEFPAAGVPFDKRVGRLVEGMALCRALWTGKPVTWPKPGSQGRWKVEASVLGPAPHRPGGPPGRCAAPASTKPDGGDVLHAVDRRQRQARRRQAQRLPEGILRRRSARD